MVTDYLEDQEIQLPKRNVWADYLFRPVVVTVMITCISISLVALGRAVTPGWWGGHILIGMILATIEAIYSFRILHRPETRGISQQRFRIAELGLLIVLLKIISLFGRPWADIGPSIVEILSQPSAIFSMDFIVMLVLAGLAWIAAYGTMNDFEGLYDPFTFRSEGITPMGNLALRFYWGGGLIIVFSGMSLIMMRSGVSGLVEMATLSNARIGGVVLNALVYFILGLVMLSQVRLTSLMTRWYIQDVQVADGLGKTWAKYGMIFLGLVAFLVIFLPTGYSLGIFDTAVLALRAIFGIFFAIAQVFMFLLTLPLAWLASLFGSEEAVESPPPDLALAPPPFAQGGGGESLPWWELVRSLAFWLVFIIVGIYLVRTYLADHPELLDALKRFAPLRWTIGIVTSFTAWLRRLIRSGIDRIPKKVDLQTSVAPEKKRRRSLWQRLRPGNLTDREQILYYYLNTLKRAEEEGVARKQDQTPYEYEPDLQQSMPEYDNDVNLLTEAFVHARYSRDTFDSEHVAMVKTIWERVQTGLRSIGQQEDEEKS